MGTDKGTQTNRAARRIPYGWLGESSWWRAVGS